MNEANLKAILKGVGLPESILSDIEKTDFDAKGVIAAFNESQKAHFKPLIENEIRPDIESEVADSINGKWLNTLNNDIKKYGVPIEKIKELKTHEKLKVFYDVLESKFKQADSSEAMKSIQQENVNLKNLVTDWEAKFNLEVEKVRTEERGKTTAKLVDIDLQKKFNSISAENILGKKHSDGIFKGTTSHMNSLYDFSQDEKGETIAFEKGTQKRVQGKNADGKEYFVPVSDLFVISLKELGFWNQSNGGEVSGQNGGGGGNGQKQKSQRLLEMEAAISKG